MTQSTFVSDEERPDLSGKRRMRRYHPWQKKIELRSVNRGKQITDQLPTLAIDARTLDMASELEPLSMAGIPFFEQFGAVMLRTEFPKWRKHGQFWRYLRGIFGPSLRANRVQDVRNRLVKPGQVDMKQLKEEIRRYTAACGFALCGFTLVDRRFIAEGADEKFPYDAAVVLGMEMERSPAGGQHLHGRTVREQ